MSLKAKIEAVIYAAEEPVTLAQLAAIFAQELLPVEAAPPERPSAGSLIAEGFLEAESFADGGTSHAADMAAFLEEAEDRKAIADPSDAEAKRAARQRDRELREQLKAILSGLMEEYAGGDRGMEIREVAGGYRIATKPEYHDAVRAFIKSLKPPMKLSLQALETLAVIAYKQPVTAPEVAEIRGVDSSGVLGSLVSRKLITTAGRKQVIGRPILYKTTREFLLRFGLKDVNELPSIEEFEKLAGDMEIGEENETPGDPRQSSQLPFADSSEAGLAAIDANAGEAGIAVEAADAQVHESDAEAVSAEVVPLEVEAPSTEQAQNVEVAPAIHPTVPIEEDPRGNSDSSLEAGADAPVEGSPDPPQEARESHG